MPKKLQIAGQKFGRLLVLSNDGNGKYGHSRWRCTCDCGKEIIVDGNLLRSGNTSSCGCFAKEQAAKRVVKMNKTHGMSRTPEHNAWCQMIGRCENPRIKDFCNYGGRGIVVCKRWRGLDGFRNFFDDMGLRPSPIHSVDRIDVNGNYEPDNCKWSTKTDQGLNKRNSRFLSAFGKRAPLSAFIPAKKYQRHHNYANNRIKRGHPHEESIKLAWLRLEMGL